MTGENQWEMSVASIILKLHGGRLKLHGTRLQYIVYWLKITDVNKHKKIMNIDSEVLGLMKNPILKWTGRIQ